MPNIHEYYINLDHNKTDLRFDVTPTFVIKFWRKVFSYEQTKKSYSWGLASVAYKKLLQV